MSPNAVAYILATIGIVCFVSIGFNLWPMPLATFRGIVCFIVAGRIRGFPGRSRS